MSLHGRALLLQILHQIEQELMRIMLIHWVELLLDLFPEHVNRSHLAPLLPHGLVKAEETVAEVEGVGQSVDLLVLSVVLR